MTPAEFKQVLGYKPSSGEKNYQSIESNGNPASVDWREKKAVTGVKNQGQCGSCWAFSTVGSVEGLYAITKGELLSFSEQQLVDCSKDGNMGCNGGDMDIAFTYLQTHKIEKESDYGYEGSDGTCRYDEKKGVFSIGGHKDVPANKT